MLTHEEDKTTGRERPATPEMPPDETTKRTFRETTRRFKAQSGNWGVYPPTQRQEAFLRDWCAWDPRLSRGEAAHRIGAIKRRTATMTDDERSKEMTRVRQANDRSGSE